MKAVENLLIGLLLGALIGWFFGFLRLPYIEKIHSFVLGFIACILLLLFVFALLYAWKKHSSLLRMISASPADKDSKTAIRTYTIIGILIAALIVAGGLLR